MQAKAHIGGHVHVGEQGIVLEHHAHTALFRRDLHRGAADHLMFNADGALTHRLQTGNGAQQSGFAAARGTNQHAHLASGQAQVHTRHRRLLAPGVMHL